MFPVQAMGDLLAGPSLFVVLLSIAFLAFPAYYLYRALAERGVFDRYLGGRFGSK